MQIGIARWGLLALTAASLAGCLGGGGGGDGTSTPTTSTPTTTTVTSQPPAVGSGNAVIKAATLTAAEFASLDLSGSNTKVTGATVSSPPKVYFNVTDSKGNPVAGLTTSNLAFAIAKLVPGTNGAPSRWVSYEVLGNSATTKTPGKPTTENTGTLVDNGNGSYVYTFNRDITTAATDLAAATVASSCNTTTNPCNKADLDDISYNANLTHRIGVQVSGRNASGTTNDDNLKTPVNLIYDFIPATGVEVAQTETDGTKQRNIVDVRNCFTCHVKFTFHGGDGLKGRGGSRQDVRFCVLCHTDQRKYSEPEAVVGATTIGLAADGNTDRIAGESNHFLPRWVHRIHMGEYLTKTGYTHSSFSPNHVKFPQDPRNCTKCHSDADGATGGNTVPQADNWKSKPSRAACGGCHDGINFATGSGNNLDGRTIGHIGGAQSSDQNCTLCHTSEVVATQHIPVSLSVSMGNANGSAINFAGDPDNRPTGAHKVAYVPGEVKLDANRRPVFKFKITLDGQDATFNTPAASPAQLLPNFAGSVGLYLVYGVAEDGVTSPADWNASQSVDLRTVFQGQASAATIGTWDGKQSDGYYQITFPASKAIPASATAVTAWMGLWHDHTNLTGGLIQTNVVGYPYTPSATNANLGTGGVNVPVTAVRKDVTGQTARRQIVDGNKCNSCHKSLGVFYKHNFHDGQRNNGEACHVCHNGSRQGNGFSKSSGHFIHGIHGAAKRTVDFSPWGATAPFWEIGYPGVLRQCTQCHINDAVNYGTTAAKAAAENGQLLWMSSAAGTVADDQYKSPWVPAGTYGAVSLTTALSSKANTRVNSPIANACNGCHTDSQAVNHMQANGGSIGELRSANNSAYATDGKLTNREGCLTCHGKGKIADVQAVHLSTVQ